MQTLQDEDEQIYSMLSRREAEYHFQLYRDASSTIPKIAEYLTRYLKDITLFHYSGHAGRDQLLLNDASANAAGIAKLLGRCPNLKLVVLNGCSTKGQVQALLHAGVPAVIATSAPVGDHTAKQFAITFFQAMSENHSSIGEAFEVAIGSAQLPNDQTLALEKKRGGFMVDDDLKAEEPLWGLYYREESDLEWKLPEKYTSKVFNSTMVKSLMVFLSNKPAIEAFFKTIPEDALDHWESKDTHLNEAQRVLEGSFAWVIGWQLRRLFAIAKEDKGIERKIKDYIHHCFITYRVSLQLVNFLLLSALWDHKKKRPDINTNLRCIQDFFGTRPLTHKELRQLLSKLCELFCDYELSFPLDELTKVQVAEYTNLESSFNKACKDMENILDLKDYGLGHCDTAEVSLAAILQAFPFFNTYKLVTIKRVEYEASRNKDPRFIKDFSVLEKKEASPLQRILKYDDKPSLTYALLFLNSKSSTNLFPFLMDYNALTNEPDFQIYLYECREGLNGIRYFSIKNEREETIYLGDAKAEVFEIQSEEQKKDLEKNMRMNLAIRQFEDAMNTLLDTKDCFQPASASSVTSFENV